MDTTTDPHVSAAVALSLGYSPMNGRATPPGLCRSVAARGSSGLASGPFACAPSPFPEKFSSFRAIAPTSSPYCLDMPFARYSNFDVSGLGAMSMSAGAAAYGSAAANGYLQSALAANQSAAALAYGAAAYQSAAAAGHSALGGLGAAFQPATSNAMQQMKPGASPLLSQSVTYDAYTQAMGAAAAAAAMCGVRSYGSGTCGRQTPPLSAAKSIASGGFLGASSSGFLGVQTMSSDEKFGALTCVMQQQVSKRGKGPGQEELVSRAGAGFTSVDPFGDPSRSSCFGPGISVVPGMSPSGPGAPSGVGVGPAIGGGGGGGPSRAELEEFNTRDLAQRISAELKRYSIPQAVFAQKVLCRSQGTLSDLLRNPKPWAKLKSGRETFRRMYKWLTEPEPLRMAALRLAGTFAPLPARPSSSCPIFPAQSFTPSFHALFQVEYSLPFISIITGFEYLARYTPDLTHSKNCFCCNNQLPSIVLSHFIEQFSVIS